MLIPDRNDPGYQEWVDRLGDKADRVRDQLSQMGLAGLSGSEAFMVRAAEIATRDPCKAEDLIQLAYDMELEAAPAIAEQLRAIASV